MKLQYEEKRQANKEEEIEKKKRKVFEKKIIVIFEHLHDTFTFNKLNSFERLIVHDLATKHKIHHKTVEDKIIISKIPFNDIESLVAGVSNVQISNQKQVYNLRSRRPK